MALINTAANLARRGRSVLAIDLDLEAPGISYLSANSQDITSKGFVDAIFGFLESPTSSPLVIGPANEAFDNYTRELDLQALAQREDSGTIHIMPAGQLSDAAAYQRRLSGIDFASLYREGLGVPIFQRFKQRLRDSLKFDYVLVDSRTGLSAEAGIAVRDLADHLIVFMGLNQQNVTGTAEFIKIVSSGEPKPKTISYVLSPMPLGEDELAEMRIKEAQNALREAWTGTPQEEPLGELQIPYHPHLALEEKPHIARLTNRALTQAYVRLEEHVRSLVNDTEEAFLREAKKRIDANEWAEAIAPLRELVRSHDPAAVLMLEQVVEQHSGDPGFDGFAEMLKDFVPGDWEAARVLATHYRESRRVVLADQTMREYRNKNPGRFEPWLELASIWQDQNWEEARKIYLKSLDLFPGNAKVLGHYAHFLWDQGNTKEAKLNYIKACAVDPKDFFALTNYALFLWRGLGNFEKAEELLKNVLELDSKYADAHAVYAGLLQVQERFGEANKHHLKAMEARPDAPRYQIGYANFLWDKFGQPDSAEIEYRVLLALASKEARKDSRTHSNYGELLIAKGKLEEAENQLGKAWLATKQTDLSEKAAILFRAALLRRIQNRSDRRLLGQLVHLIQKEQTSVIADFSALLREVGPKLVGDDRQLYQEMAAVLTASNDRSRLSNVLLLTGVEPTKLGEKLFDNN